MRSLKTAHLFRIIQSFLSGNDYLSLMNCSKEVFRSIKLETVKFFVHADEPSEDNISKIFELIPSLVEKVDSPNKQLSLQLLISSPTTIDPFRLIISDLNSITIITDGMTTSDFSDFDFTLFNNIPVVSLSGFPGVQRITNGLENVHHLTLNIPDLMEIYEFPSSRNLQELRLLNCYDTVYHKLPVTTNFDEKFIQFQLSSGIKECRLVRKEDYGSSNILSLQSIKLEKHSPDFHNDLNSLIKIEHLEIWNGSSDDPFPDFPIFHGKELIFYGFRLHSWVSELKEIRSLELSECDTLESLPSMPNLKILKLIFLPTLKFLPTFPKCYFMQLESLEELISIDSQPKLKEMKVVNIQNENLFKIFDGQVFKYLDIGSNGIKDLSWARNTYRSVLSGDFNMETFVNDSLIPSDQRECHLSDGYEGTNFSALNDFKKVKIENMDYFDDNQEESSSQLSNIQDLTISRSISYTSTKNISNIRNRLCLGDLYELTSVDNLQNIPWVVLYSLPKLEDFSGLGNNDHVYVYRVPHLEEAVEKYVVDKEAGRIELNPFYEIFSTIKSLSIIIKGPGDGEHHFDWEKINDFEIVQLW